MSTRRNTHTKHANMAIATIPYKIRPYVTKVSWISISSQLNQDMGHVPDIQGVLSLQHPRHTAFRSYIAITCKCIKRDLLPLCDVRH